MSTYKIQLRGDISSNWTIVNPILDERELAIETDTLGFKIGNGVLNWNSLPYANISSAGSNIVISDTTISLDDNIEVISLSAGTIYSGGTDLYDIFLTPSDIPTVPTQYEYDLIVAGSDETTNISSGATKITFYAPNNFTLTAATATLTTSGSTTTIVDLNYNEASVFSSPISLESGVFFNTSATTTTAIVQNGKFTIDIDAAGINSKGLKIALLGYKSF
jgi:hypothetical protein